MFPTTTITTASIKRSTVTRITSKVSKRAQSLAPSTSSHSTQQHVPKRGFTTRDQSQILETTNNGTAQETLISTLNGIKSGSRTSSNSTRHHITKCTPTTTHNTLPNISSSEQQKQFHLGMKRLVQVLKSMDEETQRLYRVTVQKRQNHQVFHPSQQQSLQQQQPTTTTHSTLKSLLDQPTLNKARLSSTSPRTTPHRYFHRNTAKMNGVNTPNNNNLMSNHPQTNLSTTRATAPITMTIRRIATKPSQPTTQQPLNQKVNNSTHPNTSTSTTEGLKKEPISTPQPSQDEPLFLIKHPQNPQIHSLISPNYPILPLSVPFLSSLSLILASTVVIALDIGKNSLAAQLANITTHQWEDDPDFIALTVGVDQDENDEEQNRDNNKMDNDNFESMNNEPPSFITSITSWVSRLSHLPYYYTRKVIEYTSRITRTVVLLGYMLPPVMVLSCIGLIDLICYFFYQRTITQKRLTTSITPTTTITTTDVTSFQTYESPQLIAQCYDLWWRLFKKTLQSSGATFTKLGQYLSSRPDILSPQICAILADLQSENESHSWESTQIMMENEFGINWNEFLYLSPSDVCGSGCIAQVYRGMFNLTRYLELQEMDQLEQRLMSGEYDDALVKLHMRLVEDINNTNPHRIPITSDNPLFSSDNTECDENMTPDNLQTLLSHQTSDMTAFGYRPGKRDETILFSSYEPYISSSVRSWLEQSGIDVNSHKRSVLSQLMLEEQQLDEEIEIEQENEKRNQLEELLQVEQKALSNLQQQYQQQLISEQSQGVKDSSSTSSISSTIPTPTSIEPFSIGQTTAFLEIPNHRYIIDNRKAQLNPKERAKMTKRIRSSIETSKLYKRKLESNPEDTILTVAVKVLHPDSVYSIHRDLKILTSIVTFVERLPFAKLQFASPTQLCAEFSRLMRTQLSMHQESLNLRRFNTSFKSDIDLGLGPQQGSPSSSQQNKNLPRSPYQDLIVSPGFPIPLLSSPSILVETYHSGIPMADFLQLDTIGDKNAKVLSQVSYVDTLYELCTKYYKHQYEAKHGIDWDQAHNNNNNNNNHNNNNNNNNNNHNNNNNNNNVDSNLNTNNKNSCTTTTDFNEDVNCNRTKTSSPLSQKQAQYLKDPRDDEYYHSHDKSATLPPTLHDLREIQQKEIAAHLSPKQLTWLRKQYAEIGLQTFLTMCFQNGFFHSDLHPGNMIVDLGYDLMDPVTLQSTLDLLDVLNQIPDGNNNNNNNNNHNEKSTSLNPWTNLLNSLPQSDDLDEAFIPNRIVPSHDPITGERFKFHKPSFLSPYYKKLHNTLTTSLPVRLYTHIIQQLSYHLELPAQQCSVVAAIKDACASFRERRLLLGRLQAVQEQFFQDRAWDPSSIFPNGAFTMSHPHCIEIFPSYDDHHEMHYRSHFYEQRIPQPAHKPKVLMIDAGMSTVLTKRDKTNFNDLFYAIAMGRGYEAAAMMIERAQPITNVKKLTDKQIGDFYGEIAIAQEQFLNAYNDNRIAKEQEELSQFNRADWLGQRKLLFEHWYEEKKAIASQKLNELIDATMLHLTTGDSDEDPNNPNHRTIFGTSLVAPQDIPSPAVWNTIHPIPTIVESDNDPATTATTKPNKNNHMIPLAPFTLENGQEVFVDTNGAPNNPLETIHIKDDVYINLQSIPYNPFQSRENRKAFILHVGDLILDVRKKNFQLDSVGVVSILTSLISASRDYCIKLDTSFISLVIAVIVFEGVGRQLDAQLDIISPSLSIIIQTQLEELSSAANAKIDQANQKLDKTIQSVGDTINQVEGMVDDVVDSDGSLTDKARKVYDTFSHTNNNNNDTNESTNIVLNELVNTVNGSNFDQTSLILNIQDNLSTPSSQLQGV